MLSAVSKESSMAFECSLPIEEYDAVTLGHGGGGKLSQMLVEQLFVPALSNDILAELHDGAMFPWHGGHVAFSTDSFVVRPRFFPGGNIGSLSVHGTLNDLAMCGARPRHLSLALILEEGLLLTELREIVDSIREACEESEVTVITGDTKVVERGSGDGIYINTTGIGSLMPETQLSAIRVRPGDKIVLNGSIAHHGMAIMSVREGLEFESEITSDSAALWPIVEGVLSATQRRMHVLRDATRGGVASAINEIAQAANVGVVLDESAIPVDEPVRAACEILGLDPLYVANEGRFVGFVSPDLADEAVDLMRAHPLGRDACIIGETVADHPGVVRMNSGFGGSRVVDMISGEQLPRIC
jgi:hydrogenase expression/formation protein HypE